MASHEHDEQVQSALYHAACNESNLQDFTDAADQLTLRQLKWLRLAAEVILEHTPDTNAE